MTQNYKLNQSSGPVPTLLAALVAALVTIAASAMTPAFAQSAGAQMKEFLKRVDDDKNGVIDPSEVESDRTRRYMDRAGLDVSQPIVIADVVAGVERKTAQRQKELNPTAGNLVAGFTVTDQAAQSTSGFELSEQERDTFSRTGVGEEMSDYVKQYLNNTLSRYDADGSGALGPEEIKRGRWDPPAKESDTNQDGILSRQELIARYVQREESRRDRRDRDDRGRDDRGRDDRGRDDRGRGRDDRGRDDRRRGGEDGGRGDRRPPDRSREEQSKSPATRSGSTGDAEQNSRDRYTKYVSGMFERYDSNGDGSLSDDEVSKMNRKPPSYGDANEDGKITKAELIDAYVNPVGSAGNRNRDSQSDRDEDGGRDASGGRQSGRQSGRGGAGGDFQKLDRNENRQIEMAEFGDDWDRKLVLEFYDKDKNRDGVITMSEWQNSD